MSPKYRFVLLDADNTLFDFDETERRALDATLLDRGVRPTEEVRALYHAINRPLWEKLHRGEVAQDFIVVERFRLLAGELGLETDPAEWNRAYLDKLGDCNALIPGAVELLEALAPQCVLALATNGVTHVQKRRLAGSPIAPFFGKNIFISGEIGAAKPHREYFEKVLGALNAPCEETVMVGDTLASDIQGAINAGIDSIWYSPNGEESPLPTYTARTMDEIKKYVLER